MKREVFFCPADITCYDANEDEPYGLVYFDRALYVVIIDHDPDDGDGRNVRVLDRAILDGVPEPDIEGVIQEFLYDDEDDDGNTVAQMVDPEQLVPASVSDEEVQEAIDSILMVGQGL
jgi:hypothetical protein